MRVALILLLVAAGCGDDDECGPGDAPVDGVTAAPENGTVTYGSFTSSPNNDCTTGAVTSLSIEGIQVDPAPTPGPIVPKIVFCIPLPDAVGAEPLALGLENTDPVRLVDVNAEIDDCTFRLDFTADPSGAISFAGYCGDGSDDAGYAISLDGAVTLTRTCGAAVDTISAGLAGSAAVSAQNP